MADSNAQASDRTAETARAIAEIASASKDAELAPTSIKVLFNNGAIDLITMEFR